MDPIAHTLTGAALAAAGLRRLTPLATAALVIGANAPDIDVVMNFAGDYAGLAHRRGWTHGVLALLVLPFVVAGGLLAYDKAVRRPRGAPPARAGPLLALSTLSVLTHPTLDWLNNYGMRWLMPFDGRWFYGDALFIIDPWVWLLLGGVLSLVYSRTAGWIALWIAFAAFGTVLVFTTEIPVLARTLWVAGIGAFAALRVAGFCAETRPTEIEWATRGAISFVATYMLICWAANIPARTEVRAVLEAAGVPHVKDVMVGPTPADPFAADVVAETPDAYYTGSWHWLGTPRFVPSPEPIPKGGGPAADAARETLVAKRYLTWSRFPYFDVKPRDDGGYVVRIADARYRDRLGAQLAGVTVKLDAELRPEGSE